MLTNEFVEYYLWSLAINPDDVERVAWSAQAGEGLEKDLSTIRRPLRSVTWLVHCGTQPGINRCCLSIPHPFPPKVECLLLFFSALETREKQHFTTAHKGITFGTNPSHKLWAKI